MICAHIRTGGNTPEDALILESECWYAHLQSLLCRYTCRACTNELYYVVVSDNACLETRYCALTADEASEYISIKAGIMTPVVAFWRATRKMSSSWAVDPTRRGTRRNFPASARAWKSSNMVTSAQGRKSIYQREPTEHGDATDCPTQGQMQRQCL